MTVRPASSVDLPAVATLVGGAGLPTVGLDGSSVRLLVAEDGGAVVGAAAVESFGDHGLLRSVAVAEPLRGTAIGTRLVAEAVTVAKSAGLRDLWLLTETAEGFFTRLGWRASGDGDLPESLRLSPEYTAHCSESAAVMVRDLAAP